MRYFPAADLRAGLKRKKRATPPLEGGEFGGEESATWTEFAEINGFTRLELRRVMQQDSIDEYLVDKLCTRLGLDWPPGYFTGWEDERDRNRHRSPGRSARREGQGTGIRARAGRAASAGSDAAPGEGLAA